VVVIFAKTTTKEVSHGLGKIRYLCVFGVLRIRLPYGAVQGEEMGKPADSFYHPFIADVATGL